MWPRCERKAQTLGLSRPLKWSACFHGKHDLQPAAKVGQQIAFSHSMLRGVRYNLLADAFFEGLIGACHEGSERQYGRVKVQHFASGTQDEVANRHSHFTGHPKRGDPLAEWVQHSE